MSMVLFLRRQRPRAAAIVRDAESLIQRYGPEAYRVAADMSWREDAGLLTAPEDGHWHRVHIEVGRRIGQAPPTWTNDIAARRQAEPLPIQEAEHRSGRGSGAEPRAALRFASTAD